MARAKVSVRLAPGGDARRARAALAGHLRDHAPWRVQVTVQEADPGQPFAATVRGPAFEAAHAAFQRAYGRPAVELGNGGTIPFVAAFAGAFPTAELLSPAPAPTRTAARTAPTRALGDFERACLAEGLLFEELATSG